MNRAVHECDRAIISLNLRPGTEACCECGAPLMASTPPTPPVAGHAWVTCDRCGATESMCAAASIAAGIAGLAAMLAGPEKA